GRFAAEERLNQAISLPPPTTAFGAILCHITGGHLADETAPNRSFQPMNVNFGLFPPMEPVERKVGGGKMSAIERGQAKKRAITARALDSLDGWLRIKTELAAE